MQGYITSTKRLFLLDYDGTLTPIVKVPHQALPSEKMLKALEEIVGDENNIVFIISGRDQEFLDSCFGHIIGLGLSAEHGSFIKYPKGNWINLAEGLDLGWQKDVTCIFDYYTERTSGSIIVLTRLLCRTQEILYNLALPSRRPRLWNIPSQRMPTSS